MTVFNILKKNCPENIEKNSWICFQLGLFFLPSSALISGLLLIKACLSTTLRNRGNYFKDPWNISFFGAGLLMIFGSIGAYSGWLAFVGLSNWIPFFWLFWAVQPYLPTSEARRRAALCFLSGTVPVVITGIGQIYLGWEGPWQLFNGLIVWFISPGGEPNGRLSGLFDYANITGAWLAFIWPISLAALLEKNLSFSKRSFVLVFAILIVLSLILTDSRNAWGALVLAIPFVLGPVSWSWLIPLLSLILMPVFFAVLPWFGLDLQQWSRTVVPEALWSRLSDIQYVDKRSFASTRISQWGVALGLILERPWFGWGAAAFSILYPLRTGQWHGHAHNLPLEISVSHGIPVAILIVLPIFCLLIIAIQKGILKTNITQSNVLKKTIFDRAWWTATFVLFVLHASDMPFFDSRLNIAGWILLAGLRCLIRY